MNLRNCLATVAVACFALPAAAQSPGKTPSSQEALQARENARRDAKMADAMEKARLKEEARPVSVYIPKAEAEKPIPVMKNPEVFSAKVPGPAKKAVKKRGRKQA